jgi:hypothetical protein
MTDLAPKRDGVAVVAFGLRGLTFELTGPMRRDGLARAGRKCRVPQTGPRQPAVAGPVVQRGVRRHRLPTAFVRASTISFRPPSIALLLSSFLACSVGDAKITVDAAVTI